MRGSNRREDACHNKYKQNKHRRKPVFGFLLFSLVLVAGISYGAKASKAAPAAVGTVATADNVQTVGYADELVVKGFPADYAAALSALHDKYPNWTFTPVKAGDWETAIQAECGFGKNLVQRKGNDAEKSTDAGAYDWATNKWTGLDGSGWVGASPDMIRYCMDPRNFLDAENIFQFATNQFQESQNAAGVLALAQDSFLAGQCVEADGSVSGSYADIFVEVGRKVDVNPYHLASRCLQEQGKKGTSDSISGTVKGYEGLYNYFNVKAYANGELTAVQAGLEYARTQNWDTRRGSIEGGADFVAKGYVHVNDDDKEQNQNTIYFEKYNVVNAKSGLYGNQYMTNVEAAISEGKIRKKAYDKDLNQPIEFRIPVYDNMPSSPCARPSSGNPNNWLSSLSVEGQELTPAFSGATTEYSLIVGQDVEKLNVSATPVASASSVSGTGEVALQYGSNALAVKCVAQNQTERTYTINVVREQEVAMVRGDANGDGKVGLADWVAVKRHMLGLESLSENAAKAVDINGDGEIGLADWVAIKRHILGYAPLE